MHFPKANVGNAKTKTSRRWMLKSRRRTRCGQQNMHLLNWTSKTASSLKWPRWLPESLRVTQHFSRFLLRNYLELLYILLNLETCLLFFYDTVAVMVKMRGRNLRRLSHAQSINDVSRFGHVFSPIISASIVWRNKYGEFKMMVAFISKLETSDILILKFRLHTALRMWWKWIII